MLFLYYIQELYERDSSARMNVSSTHADGRNAAFVANNYRKRDLSRIFPAFFLIDAADSLSYCTVMYVE